jgi:ribonuclease HII
MTSFRIGVDEAGRGCLWGRVYAGAVHIPPSIQLPSIDGNGNGKNSKRNAIVLRDSKKMSALQRERARSWIEEQTVWGVGFAEAQEIESEGIVTANLKAMHRAIDALMEKVSLPLPDPGEIRVLVDGCYFERYRGYEYELVVRGESEHPEIAAASILAKTHRDAYVQKWCDDQPKEVQAHERYGLQDNKGYGTNKHITGLRQHGPLSGTHRLSFLSRILSS